MRSIALVLAVLLCMTAAVATLEIEVQLADRYVHESFTYTGDPGPVRFELPAVPVSVASDEEYVLEGSTIAFDTNGTSITFTALFDGLIVASGSDRAFRSSFSADEVILRIVLPRGAALVDAVPQGELSTDGSSISIAWPSAADRSVAVFYMVDDEVAWWWFVAFMLPIIIASGAFFAWRTKTRTIDALISVDERAVLDQIDGTRTQNEIARGLGFSKSKMSKVVRKLEEKGLVGKEPHFKTNKLKRL